MDAIRTAFSKISGRGDAGWIAWTPPAKAEAGPATPADSVSLQGAAPAVLLPWAELQRLGMMSAAAATPGPLGAVLSAEARSGLADFLRRMDASGARLALSRPAERAQESRYKPMAPQEAMTWLESQPAAFSSFAAVWTAADPPVPVSSLSDLMTLDALSGAGGAVRAPDAALGESLRSLVEQGWQVTSEPPSWGAPASHAPLQAYNTLQNGKRVEVAAPSGTRSVQAHRPDDVVAIDFFEGAGVDRGLSQPEVASTLRTLAREGYRLQALDQKESSPGSALEAYTSLPTCGRVLVQSAGSDAAFHADAALLSDADRVRERAAEVDRLYLAHVRPPETYRRSPRDIANFFSAVYADFSGLPREQACERLAALGATTGFSAPAVFNEILAAASTDGDVDGRIADYTRIAKAGMADAERLPAFRFLETELPRLAGSDSGDRAALREAFMSIMERTHSRPLAQQAVETCSFPVSGLTLAERAEAMRTIASTYHSDWNNELVTDYVAAVTPQPATPLERVRLLADTLRPLQDALGRRISSSDVRQAHVAQALTLLQVGDETQAERTAVMLKLIESRVDEPAATYHHLLLHRLPDEGLAETADTYSQVAAGLAPARAQNRAADVFTALQDARRTSPSLQRDEVMGRFNEAMVLNGDVDQAVAAATRPSRAAGTIKGDDQAVTIGGIRVQRNVTG